MSVWDDDRVPASLWDDPDDWEIPAGIPRHKGNERPQIRRADNPTKFDYLPRASSLGEHIDKPFAIYQRQLELVTWEMARNEALQTRALAVFHTGADRDPRMSDLAGATGLLRKAIEDEIKADRQELRRIYKEANLLAGGMDAATKGTAAHAVYYRANLGKPLDLPPSSQLQAVLTERQRLLSGWRVHCSEVFVVWDCVTCSEFTGRTITHTAGSLDAAVSPLGIYRFTDVRTGEVVEIHPDDAVVVDDKSGAWGVTSVGYTCQMPSYGLGTPYRHVSDAEAAQGVNGRYSWDELLPAGVTLRRDYVMIPHVPFASPQDSGITWVNVARASECAHHALAAIEAGKGGFADAFSPEGAMLDAIEVQGDWHVPGEMSVDEVDQLAEWEATRPSAEGGTREFVEGEPMHDETPALHQVMTVNGLLELVERAPDEQAIRALHLEHAPLWTPYVAAKARARMSDLGLEVPAS